MKKNRRVSKRMNVNTTVAMHIGAIVLAAFVMVILNFLASSSCQQLAKKIGDKEKLLAQLTDTYDREEMQWEEMKTPVRLNEALRKHGLAMRAPNPSKQTVHMSADGRPYFGQLAVRNAQRRNLGVAHSSKNRR